MKRSTSTCRLRKVSCPDCGYTVRMTRSWMLRGFPHCPCGSSMEPTEPSDRAFCGLIGQSDMEQAAWNTICRENGWDIVRNQGQAARRLQPSAIHHHGAAHCAYSGCGLWVAAGAEYCNAGHAQAEDCPEPAAAIPF